MLARARDERTVGSVGSDPLGESGTAKTVEGTKEGLLRPSETRRTYYPRWATAIGGQHLFVWVSEYS